jgi:hypothetical protein
MRAYPDDGQVLRRVRALIPRLPHTDNVYAYSYWVLRRLVRLFPGRIEIEWDEVEDDRALLDALDLLVLPGESQALEDTSLSLRDWFLQAKSNPDTTDLEFLIDLLEGTSLSPAARVFLFENADLPIRYRGPGRARIELRPGRIHYQRRGIESGRLPLASHIRRPLRRVTRGGQRTIDLALQALCARNLEIYPLVYANPSDVVVADCGRGLSVVLIGVLPEWRSALESLYVFLPLKNGVPLAYGPASVCLGCCETGVNLFPEFRGAETRSIYAQVMRVLHHRLGADYFLLTRYAMGEENEDALKAGSFWFYRKLGFAPTNPEVELLARAEEVRMAAEPGYRCDRRTLRREAAAGPRSPRLGREPVHRRAVRRGSPAGRATLRRSDRASARRRANGAGPAHAGPPAEHDRGSSAVEPTREVLSGSHASREGCPDGDPSGALFRGAPPLRRRRSAPCRGVGPLVGHSRIEFRNSC